VRRRRQVGLVAGGLVGVGLVAGYLLFYVPTRAAVHIGAGMLAKQVCSCVHIAGREVADCRADEFASMDPIQLELREARVRAFVPLFGERTAIHRDGLGCALE